MNLSLKNKLEKQVEDHLVRKMKVIGDIFIGASLSEPHTSVTALRDACVCMSVGLRPYTVNFK